MEAGAARIWKRRRISCSSGGSVSNEMGVDKTIGR
jgi:hypothetical protein